jgi:HK97 family phage major capsid protein
MKWAKYLQADADANRKAGEVVQIEDSEFATLKRLKFVEETTEPEAVTKSAATADDAPLVAAMTEMVDGRFAQFEKRFADSVKGAAKRPIITEVHENADDDLTCGFGPLRTDRLKTASDADRAFVVRKGLGEQLLAVKTYRTQSVMDPRLQRMQDRAKAAPATFGSEAIGADGGFGIAPDFSPELMRHAYSDTSLLPKCRQFTTGGNTFIYPKDETVAWGTDGVQAYWQAEGTSLSLSKPKIGEGTLSLNKLTVLVPVTNELLDDNAINLGSYIGQVAPEKIADKINGAIVSGTGAGQPLGILNSGALKVVAKVSNQSTGTIVTQNVASMLAGLPAYSTQNAVWLYHATTLQQIIQLTIGQQPVFTPVGGMNNAPFGALFGRPIFPSEQCQPLSTEGDLYLVDLTKYMAVLKAGGIQQAVSMHIYFDADITAFRFTFRMAGQPWMSAPITQKNGGGTLSPFVALASR